MLSDCGSGHLVPRPLFTNTMDNHSPSKAHGGTYASFSKSNLARDSINFVAMIASPGGACKIMPFLAVGIVPGSQRHWLRHSLVFVVSVENGHQPTKAVQISAVVEIHCR